MPKNFCAKIAHKSHNDWRICLRHQHPLAHSHTFSHTLRNWSVLITCKCYWSPHPLSACVCVHVCDHPTAVTVVQIAKGGWFQIPTCRHAASCRPSPTEPIPDLGGPSAPPHAPPSPAASPKPQPSPPPSCELLFFNKFNFLRRHSPD